VVGPPGGPRGNLRAAVAEDLDRPVTTAAVRAGEFVEQARRLAGEHTAVLERTWSAALVHHRRATSIMVWEMTVGRPPTRPRARAAAKPSRVPSEMVGSELVDRAEHVEQESPGAVRARRQPRLDAALSGPRRPQGLLVGFLGCGGDCRHYRCT
jgi:hypothetical protein